MSSSTGNVLENEVYPTPLGCVLSIMSVITFRPDDIFLEPCKGDDVIRDQVPLPEHRKLWAEIRSGRDYLKSSFPQVDVIITNPPFSLSTDFLRKSFSELAPDGTLIYLQRVNWLGSIKRVGFWGEIGFPNKFPIIIPRPRFDKRPGKSGDSCEYAWFIWDKGGRVHLPNGLSHLFSVDIKSIT